MRFLVLVSLLQSLFTLVNASQFVCSPKDDISSTLLLPLSYYATAMTPSTPIHIQRFIITILPHEMPVDNTVSCQEMTQSWQNVVQFMTEKGVARGGPCFSWTALFKCPVSEETTLDAVVMKSWSNEKVLDWLNSKPWSDSFTAPGSASIYIVKLNDMNEWNRMKPLMDDGLTRLLMIQDSPLLASFSADSLTALTDASTIISEAAQARGCYSTLLSCQQSTSNCTSAGTCQLVSAPGATASQICYKCVCNYPQGGSQCQDIDVSAEAVIMTTIILLILIVVLVSIALLASVEAGVIGSLVVGGGHSKQE